MNKTLKIILTVVIIAAVGLLSYFIFFKESLTPSPTSPPTDQGAYIPKAEEIIRILFPNGGENLEIGKEYDIKWENYLGDEPLNIGLQVTTPNGKSYLKYIALNVPAARTGVYKWKVTSEPIEYKYKVEVYSKGNRPLVGRSKNYFSIKGDLLLMVNTPQPLEEVISPIKIIGKARRIFSEGEFIVRAREWGTKSVDGNKFQKLPVIAEAIAFVPNCDWMSGNWCDFTVNLNVPAEKLKNRNVIIEFYQRDERFGEKLIYEFLVSGEMEIPGEGFLQIQSPARNAEVISPIVITGKAKGIFVNGQFRIALWAQDYPYGHPKAGESRLIDSVYTTLIDENCNWVGEDWCDFKGEIYYQTSEIGKASNSLNFYRGGKGELGEGFLMTWPIQIKK